MVIIIKEYHLVILGILDVHLVVDFLTHFNVCVPGKKREINCDLKSAVLSIFYTQRFLGMSTLV
jgi:hypothetical protein